MILKDFYPSTYLTLVYRIKTTIIGTCYVGIVTGACLSDEGVDVTCVVIDQNKIDGLKNSILPIYEPGLEEIVKRNNKKGRLNFSMDLDDAICGSEATFIAVGTPPGEDGSADLKYVLAVALNALTSGLRVYRTKYYIKKNIEISINSLRKK